MTESKKLPTRRDMLRAASLGAIAAVSGDAFAADHSNEDIIMQNNEMKPALEAKSWSELPAVLKEYERQLDAADGISRIFTYASLIPTSSNPNPGNMKKPNSKSIPNEKARLPGMEVAMNVLAAGEYEFRGTRGTYTNAEGKRKLFANVGVYAGLESSSNGTAEGMNITAGPQDRRAFLKDYIDRELGAPPANTALDDLFDAPEKFLKLKGTPEDKFKMYKFQIVETDTSHGKAPSITVATNEDSKKFARIGMTPMQTAHLILDGQGYSRTNPDGSKIGGAALDYFKKSVMKVARDLKLNHPKLEAIDAAVEELAAVNAKWDAIVKQKLPPEKEHELFQEVINQHPDIVGIGSPRFGKGDNSNERRAVPPEEQVWPENAMPVIAEGKYERIAKLREKGATDRTRF